MTKTIVITGLFVLLAGLSLGCEEKLGVKDVSPAVGVLGGGEPVNINGSGFTSGMGVTVYFGNQKADNVVVSGSKQLTVSTPSSTEEKVVDVRIVLDSGEEFLMKEAFRYVAKGAIDIRDLGKRKSMRKTSE